MKMPLVSVIIPCFNSELFVMEAVNSALHQVYENIEILLIDNNSTDSTLEVLMDFQLLYPEKIRVFKELKKGAPAARNKGLREAKGKWIQFLDSDDILLPEKISYQISLVLNSNSNLVIGDYLLNNHHYNKKIKAKSNPWDGLLSSRLGITCSNLWSAELLNKVCGWDENQISSQEYHLLFAILKLNPILTYSRPIDTIVFQRKESISKTEIPEKKFRIFDENLQLRVNIKAYLEEKGSFNKTIEQTYEIHFLRLLIWSKYKSNSFYQKHYPNYRFKLPFYLKHFIIIEETIRRYSLLTFLFFRKIIQK